jgi:hypothetical protein
MEYGGNCFIVKDKFETVFDHTYSALALASPMRDLAEHRVLKRAATAAFVCALASYPRLALWPNRLYPLWYLGALLVLGGTVLWGFVFAWHTKYTGRPVFTLKVPRYAFLLATFSGIGAAVLLHFVVDPSLRLRNSDEYPANVREWIAMTLFSLGFTQLFLVFAAFSWLVRLVRKAEVAAIMTAVFGLFVLWFKNHSSKTPLPPSLLMAVLLVRLVVGLLSVYFFLRGGVLLVWWWSLLVQIRHLIGLL